MIGIQLLYNIASMTARENDRLSSALEENKLIREKKFYNKKPGIFFFRLIIKIVVTKII